MSEQVLPRYADLDDHRKWAAKFALAWQRQGRINPVLLHGTSMSELPSLASRLACLPFCRDKSACGRCPECLQVLAGNESDVLWVGGDPEQRLLKVEAARAVAEHLDTAGTPCRVVIIEGADRLGIDASNKLLKLIEEPPHGSLIVMTTERVRVMLPTVLSRVLKVRAFGVAPHCRALTPPQQMLMNLAASRDRSWELITEIKKSYAGEPLAFLNDMELSLRHMYAQMIEEQGSSHAIDFEQMQSRRQVLSQMRKRASQGGGVGLTSDLIIEAVCLSS